MALVSLASPSYEFASLGLLRRVLRASLQTVNFHDDQTWPLLNYWRHASVDFSSTVLTVP